MSTDLGRVAEAFEHALSLAPEQRAGYLTVLGRESELLAKEVSALLAADEAADQFLGQPIVAREELELAPRPPRDRTGEVLGPYRIVGHLGSGGMSDVYLAERAGEDFVVKVAIKMLRPEMPFTELRTRLTRERRLLASLRHPHIAQLLDGGSTAEGQPYLVMEYVDGVSIDAHCRTARLTLRERLELFRQICDAVAYAHRSLVIHRDIKPSNIVVDRTGKPKLLDFGIAKLIRDRTELDDPSGASASTTAAAFRLLTPRYASPEQIRGEPTTTASDVFSLGVLLYELLTGTAPHEGVSERRAIEESVLSVTPDAPSRRVLARGDVEGLPLPARAWAAQLRGDLDNIVAMAMRKEPERRYSSVEQLAGDVERHLESLPVLARPDTARYRAAKFVRRHRAAVVAASIVTAALVGSVVSISWQLRQTARERDRASREAETANRTAAFLESLFRVADPREARGRDVSARELVARAARTAKSGLEGEPRVQGRMLRTLGSVHLSLGLYDAADSLLADAVTVLRPEAEGEARELASALDSRANLAKQRGDLAGAVALAKEALDLRERQLGKESLATAQSLNNLAVLKLRLDELDEAEALFERAVSIRERQLGPHHLDVAGTWQNLGNLYGSQGRREDARGAYLRARSSFETAGGADHPGVAAACGGLAQIASEEGRHAAAESLQLRALAIREKLYGEVHDAVANDLANLALVRKNGGDLPGAEAAATRALSIYSRTVGESHPYYAETLVTLSQLALARADSTGAARNLRQARSIFVSRLPDGHPSIQNVDELLAVAERAR